MSAEVIVRVCVVRYGRFDGAGRELNAPTALSLTNYVSFQDGIFYACEGDNGLARAAGEQAVSFFSEYLGPNIWRGRVEQYHPRYVRLYHHKLVIF